MDNQAIDLKRKIIYALLIFSSFLMYILFISVKNTFAAEIVMIMKVFDIDKPTASMTTTYYFFTYGITQILLFFLISKFNIKKFLTVTLSISAVLMIAVGFCTGIVQIYVIFAISGVVQAGLWAGIIAVLSLYLPTKKLAFANKMMALGEPVAFGISYGFSSIFNAFGNWNMPFIILGAMSLASVVLFFYVTSQAEKVSRCDKMERTQENLVIKKEAEYQIFNLNTVWKKTGYYVVMMVLSFLAVSVYRAIINWIPSLMADVFAMNESVSTLITTIVPIAIIIGPMIVIDCCEKHKNTMLVGTVFFGASLPFILYMVLFYDFNVVVSLIVLVIFLNLLYGARVIFSSVVAFKMKDQLNAGAYSALGNAFASFGVSFAPTIVGAIIETSGWAVSYFAIMIMVVVIVLILIALSFIVHANIKKQKLQIQE